MAANVGAQREPVRAALWDVASSPQYRKHWEALAQVRHTFPFADTACSSGLARCLPHASAGLAARRRSLKASQRAHTAERHPSPRARQGLDGLLLVVDPARADECERELEACYLKFAQPHALTTRQCMVLALDVRGTAAAVGGTPAWPGERARRRGRPAR